MRGIVTGITRVLRRWYASKRGNEWSKIAWDSLNLPWPKPGEGDYVQVRYARVRANGVVLCPMVEQKMERKEGELGVLE